MISLRELQRMAFEQRVPEQMIERDYVLAWMLGALAAPDSSPRLVAKGGTSLKRIFFADWRFSEDLDFTSPEPWTEVTLKTFLGAACRQVRAECGLDLEVGEITLRMTDAAPRNATAYLSYVGPLQRIRRPRQIKLDVTFDEILVNKPVIKPVIRTFSDEPLPPKMVVVYSLEEICAEKLRTLQQRTEPRDLYDIWRILSERSTDMDMSVLNATYIAKCTHKKLPHVEGRSLLTDDHIARFQKSWASRLQEQMPDIPPVETVVRETRRLLRQNLI
jgi:uncharacterized protein